MFSAGLAVLQGSKSLIPRIFGVSSVRHGHRIRGKRPGVARTLAQRSEEVRLKNYDPEVEKLIDIGFPKLHVSRSVEQKKQSAHLKELRQDPELERRARNHQLEIDLEKVQKEWHQSSGQIQIKNIATHYGIYNHLFGRAYFLPRIHLNVKYELSEDLFVPVCYGNVIKPHEARSQPIVTFDSRTNLLDSVEDNTLWTLVLTNPDGHFTENDKEYAHWFVGNIPNDDVSKGEVIVPYLQPFPPKGTGFHRHVFILYKQNKRIDFSEYKVEKLNDLEKRTFSTLDFYKKLQDDITPAGLAFFQADYDTTLSDFFRNVLDIKEPVYEYDFPRQYLGDEEVWAKTQPFNKYLDKYRDPKQINKEYLERKLQKIHPFDGPEPELKYPDTHYYEREAKFPTDLQQGRIVHGRIKKPSWLKVEERKQNRGWGRINDFK